jgi:4-amino-4-deoxy-L-arabinose transferase-like glycosyltransferase
VAVSGLFLRLHRGAVPTTWPRLRLLALAPAALLLALYVIFYARFAAKLIAFPYGWDQGEAYDAWSAWLVAQGQLPYSFNSAFPYFSINYPPLWSTLMSLPMLLTGPSLVPPRLLAVLLTLADAALVGAAAWRLTRSLPTAAFPRLAAGLAAVLFLASPYVFHTTPLSRLNSMLTLFLLLALTLVERPTPRRVALCLACLLAAAFTKPTGIFAAVACLGWLLATRPRVGLAASGAFGLAAGAMLFLLNAVTGGAFWLNVVAANSGAYIPAQTFGYFANFISVHPVVVAFALTESWRRCRDGQWSPWMAGLAASLLAATFVGHAGAGESYFLDVIAIGSVLSSAAIARIVATLVEDPPGVEADRSGHAGGGPWPGLARLADPVVVFGALLFAQTLMMAHGPLSYHVGSLPDRGLQAWILGREPTGDDLAAGAEIVDLIRAAPGPVLSEEPSFALAGGKEIVANANHLRDLDDKGLWQGRALVRDIEQRRFALIVLNAQRYPPAVLAAIGRSYYVTRSIPMGAGNYLVFYPGAIDPGPPLVGR